MDMENMENEGLEEDPCEDAINLLWKEIVIARQGEKYGDWEYPGQAYRHIKAEFDDLLAENAELRKALRAIFEANRTMADMSQPLEEAARVLGGER